MVRSLPDEDVPTLMNEMRAVINDPAVELSFRLGVRRPPAPPSGLNTEMFGRWNTCRSASSPRRLPCPPCPPGPATRRSSGRRDL